MQQKLRAGLAVGVLTIGGLLGLGTSLPDFGVTLPVGPVGIGLLVLLVLIFLTIGLGLGPQTKQGASQRSN